LAQEVDNQATKERAAVSIGRSIAWIAACAVTLLCAAARAQDAPPAEGVSPPPAVSPPAVSSPQPGPPRPLTPEERRRLVRHDREVAQLKAVMEKEGDSFSSDKYDSYGRSVGVGVPLLVVGVAALIAGLVCAGYDLDHLGQDSEKGGMVSGAAIAALILGGAVVTAAGASLLVAGLRGRQRQKRLRRKDEILAPFDPRAVQVSLSLYGDRNRGAGGLALRVQF
jgi:hypothetical protein